MTLATAFFPNSGQLHNEFFESPSSRPLLGKLLPSGDRIYGSPSGPSGIQICCVNSNQFGPDGFASEGGELPIWQSHPGYRTDEGVEEARNRAAPPQKNK